MQKDENQIYFESQEFKDILAKYESARDGGLSTYMDADDLIDVAEYYSSVKHDEVLARGAAEYALNLHPDAVEPQVFLARQSMAAGNVEDAEQRLKYLKNESDREVIFLRMELMIRRQQIAEALEMLTEYSNGITEDRDYLLYDAAYIFVDNDCYDEAASLSEKLEEMAPKWYRTWELRADVLLAQEKYEEALPYITHMLDKDPFDIDAWNWNTEALTGVQQFEKAIESCDYALAIEPQDERAKQLKAWTLLQLRSYEDAHALYTELQEQNPKFEGHWLYDAYCLYYMDKADEALNAVNRAEKLAKGRSSEQENIFQLKACMLSNFGNLKDALDYLDKAQKVASDKSDYHKAEYEMLRARTYIENAKLNDGQNYIHKALALVPDHVREFYCTAAQILFEARYYEIALALFDSYYPESEDSDEEMRDIYGYMAACHHYLNHPDDVLKCMQIAVEAGATNLEDLFGDIIPEGVALDEYPLYYYYFIHGHWPDEQA